MIVREDRPAGSLAAPAKACEGSGVGRMRPPLAAFTLLEILISLALIALLIGATISMVPHSDTALTTDEVFWKALTEARKQALTTQQDIRLAFDLKAKALVIGANIGMQTDAKASTQMPCRCWHATGTSTGCWHHPNHPGAICRANSPWIFSPSENPATSSILIGGELVETGPLPFVTLYSDGTCTPFRVQFHSNGAARIIAHRSVDLRRSAGGKEMSAGAPAVSPRPVPRGFTLLEVLFALLIFVGYAVVLGSSYINVLNTATTSPSVPMSADEDVEFGPRLGKCSPSRTTTSAEQGGEYDSANGRHVSWHAQIDRATQTVDLFCGRVYLRDQRPERARARARYDHGKTSWFCVPTWSDPRRSAQPLLDAAKQQIEKLQGVIPKSGNPAKPLAWAFFLRRVPPPGATHHAGVRAPRPQPSGPRGRCVGSPFLEILLSLALVMLVMVGLNTFIFSMGELWGRRSESRLLELHVRAVSRDFLDSSNCASPRFRPKRSQTPRRSPRRKFGRPMAPATTCSRSNCQPAAAFSTGPARRCPMSSARCRFARAKDFYCSGIQSSKSIFPTIRPARLSSRLLSPR